MKKRSSSQSVVVPSLKCRSNNTFIYFGCIYSLVCPFTSYQNTNINTCRLSITSSEFAIVEDPLLTCQVRGGSSTPVSCPLISSTQHTVLCRVYSCAIYMTLHTYLSCWQHSRIQASEQFVMILLDDDLTGLTSSSAERKPVLRYSPFHSITLFSVRFS